MTNFTATLNFTSQDLSAIHSTGAKVIAGRCFQEDHPNVAWTVFEAMKSCYFSWSNEAQLYASSTRLEQSQPIDVNSTTSNNAAIGKQYLLNSKVVFEGPTEDGDKGFYKAANHYDNRNSTGFMSLGTFQSASINGNKTEPSPSTAQQVLYQSALLLEDTTTLGLWVQPDLKTGDFIEAFSAPLTLIEFTDQKSDVTLKYDSGSGKFIAQENPENLIVRHLFSEMFFR